MNLTMTKDIQSIITMYNTGSEEFRSAVLRGLRIYSTGSEKQKQILDRIGNQKMSWGQALETINQAENAE